MRIVTGDEAAHREAIQIKSLTVWNQNRDNLLQLLKEAFFFVRRRGRGRVAVTQPVEGQNSETLCEMLGQSPLVKLLLGATETVDHHKRLRALFNTVWAIHVYMTHTIFRCDAVDGSAATLVLSRFWALETGHPEWM